MDRAGTAGLHPYGTEPGNFLGDGHQYTSFTRSRQAEAAFHSNTLHPL